MNTQETKTLANNAVRKLAEKLNIPQLCVDLDDNLKASATIPCNGAVALIAKTLTVEIEFLIPVTEDENYWITLKSQYSHHCGGTNGIERSFIVIINTGFTDKSEVHSVVSRDDYMCIATKVSRKIHAKYEGKKVKAL